MTASENQIVVYQPNETVRLDVRLENETVWLTQLKIAELFGVQKAAISKHVRNIFASGELARDATVSKMETVQTEGGRSVVRTQEFFNLDVIIAVGYRVNSQRATQFRIWATKVLKEYLLRGYSVNARLNQLEDTMHRNLAKHDDRLATLEQKVDFFVQTQSPPLQGVFYDGQLWDARALVLKLIQSAKRSLILIDNWATPETLDLFAKKRKGVKVTIVTSEHYDKKHVPHRKISPADIATFNAQYPRLAVRYNETFHDRFLIIDDKELYLIGASLKDLGRKCFAFTKLDAGAIRGIKKSAFAAVKKGSAK
ncbi:MAG: virulence RhuM family protein [Bacteroidales bacterium]|nr:virulence RhuM family protein [Bacteroidales bacterium]